MGYQYIPVGKNSQISSKWKSWPEQDCLIKSLWGPKVETEKLWHFGVFVWITSRRNPKNTLEEDERPEIDFYVQTWMRHQLRDLNDAVLKLVWMDERWIRSCWIWLLWVNWTFKTLIKESLEAQVSLQIGWNGFFFYFANCFRLRSNASPLPPSRNQRCHEKQDEGELLR